MKRFPVRLNTRDGTVDMTHGSGGRSMAHLIEELFVKHFDNDLLRQANDQAAFSRFAQSRRDVVGPAVREILPLPIPPTSAVDRPPKVSPPTQSNTEIDIRFNFIYAS